MPKIAKELTAIAVAKLKAPGRYAVGGAKGLHLRITPAGARLWVCRLLTPDGRRQDIGLGSPPDVSLSDARDKARDAYRAVQAGAAPAPRSKAAKPQPPTPAHTFRAAALELVAAKGAAWSNAKHLAQWTRSLEAHAFPTIGQMDVADIGLDHVLQVLRPIWTTKTETATRIRGRIEATLDYAAVHGWRAGDNPARWKGLLDKVLPSPLKISTPEHHKAMPAEAVPSLMASLCAANTLAALALRLLILTAARSGEVRGAVWAEFDVVAGVWIIPAARMKAKTEHRIPLSTQALALLKAIHRIEDCPLLFPSATSLGRPISDMTMTALLRRRKLDCVPHGFRSSFRDWAGDSTEYPRELLEAALAHTVSSKVEAAYRRKDALERRRPLTQDWADFLTGSAAATARCL